ncbi:MAG: hypothetical protein ACK5LK_03055, partial [Chthoniobacterales bacterium]
EWLESLIGPQKENAQTWEKLQVMPRVREFILQGSELPPLLFTCGTEDYLLATNRRFVDEIKAINAQNPSHPIRFEYRESPGGHDWHYWESHGAEIAKFHWQYFNGTKE